MSLESVRDELLSNAKIKAKEIVDRAKQESIIVKKKAEEAFAGKKQAFEEETASLIAGIKAREKSAANLEAKKLLFGEKKDKIDDVFASAKKSLAELPPKEREKLIKRLVEKASREIHIGKIYCSPEDERFISPYPVVHAAISGGIIAENAEGTLRVDYSIDTMIAEFREKQLNEVVAVLFG